VKRTERKVMDNIIVPLNHHSVISANMVNEICKPLFDHTDINFFHYARIFDNHKTYTLTTHVDFHRHHLKEGYKLTPSFPHKVVQKNFHYILNANISGEFSQAYYDFRNLFGIDHPLFLIERYQHYFDLFMFGTKTNNEQIVNFYLNNLIVLEQFKFYFKDKASQLIKQAQESVLYVPHSMQPSMVWNHLTTSSATENKKYQLLKKMPTKHYYFEDLLGNVPLTEREVRCLKAFTSGYTVKESAKLMKLSPRTIEYHLENIKAKLSCQRKADLMKLFSERIFINL
jgi:LuxR family quorum-sensing system transcriptional regulator SolR